MTTAANSPASDGRAGPRPGRRALWKWLGTAVVAGLLVWFVPLVRVVPLDESGQGADPVAFDARSRVDDLWSGGLLEAAEAAVEVEELRAALRSDPAGAAGRFGHRLGLSGSASFLLRGEGRVVELGEEMVGIAVGESDEVAVQIELGPVFGNAIRDGSGLLDVSDFANTREFNDLSAEINRRVEEEVLPKLRAGAVVGAKLRFAGGFELADGSDPAAPLPLVPVFIEFP